MPRATGALLIIVMVLGAVTPAIAAPLDAKRAEAARIQAQIDALDADLEIAAEDYNEAKGRYEAVTAEVKATEERLTALSARQGELETGLATRAQGMYRQGPLGMLELLLGVSTFEEFATVWGILQDLNEADATRIADLKSTRAEVAATQEQLAAKQAEAKAESDEMQARKSAVEAQIAERTRILDGVQAEITAILREQAEAERRRAAAAAAAAKASAVYTAPTNAPRSAVVKIALSKLGSPYKWAASGPNSFDCSGFTMWCYAQVGVSLPHSSRAQYGVGQRVSRADLAPGDLVFFGKSRIHHVGIYIGSGNFVHAPHTGDVVKVSSLSGRSDYVGATRP